MNLKLFGLGLIALSACQAAPALAPLQADEIFADVTFEFDT